MRGTRPGRHRRLALLPTAGTGFFERVQAQLGKKTTGSTATTSARFHMPATTTSFTMLFATHCTPRWPLAQPRVPARRTTMSAMESASSSWSPRAETRNVLSLPLDLARAAHRAHFQPLEGVAGARRSDARPTAYARLLSLRRPERDADHEAVCASGHLVSLLAPAAAGFRG